MFSKKSNTQTAWIGLSFLTLGLIAGLLLAGGGAGLMDAFGLKSADNAVAQQQVPDVDVNSLETVSVSIDDDAFLGNENAPVTIVEFSDYECPYCRSFVNETLPLIKENYIDTGKVKLVFRDFPLPSHGEADEAAQAAECVRAQSGGSDENFFVMHDFLFNSVASWAGKEDVKDILINIADQELGIDIATCLNNDEMLDEINQDYTAAKGYGVTGTPTFFINGKKLVGAWPYEVFVKVIESQL